MSLQERPDSLLEATGIPSTQTAIDEELRCTFGALRQLSQDVKEILVVQNRELNQSALWALGRWWSEEVPRRPTISRTVMNSRRVHVSGALKRSGGMKRR